MIGSFWNLCRACPSMPVDKLHSEYRSTYRWHEVKAEQQQQQAGVMKQPAPNPPTALSITRGPIEPAMPRRKKYPGVAYRTNELFDPAPVDDIRPQQTSAFNRARSAQRNESDRAGRRSKSEGPRQPRWTDTVEPKPTTAMAETLVAKEPDIVSTEYRNQFAWPKDTTDSAPRKSISMGALKKAAAAEGLVEAEPLMNHADDHDDHGQKRYIEDYLWNGQKPGVQRGKGKSSGDAEASERMLGGGEAGAGGEMGEGGAGEDAASTLRGAGLQPLGRARGESWYREVLDLRKRAGEYKYRGWGTELAPEHITQLYNKQIELWYQVSRRSSLSALSLASTNHKALPRDEKDGKDSKNHSPKKFRSFRSAPHQSIHAKLQETKVTERSPHKTSPQKQRKKLQGHSFDEGHAQEGKTEVKGEFRSPRRRPRSADPAPVAPAKQLPNGHEPHPRPHKPTDDDIPNHRSASVAKDHFFDDSPVVKSPPEPTRVKSPEQMNMRSPDPVNWTVPLDTGKTFTVTQNVKSEITPVHHQQMSPIRSLKKSESPTSLSKRTDKTPTTPISLTPIDETRALDANQLNGVNGINGVNGVNGLNSNQTTPEDPTNEPLKEKEVVKKSIEATQVAPGVVDTTVVNEPPATGGLTAAEVLDRARNRFDKFWGKKDEDNV